MKTEKEMRAAEAMREAAAKVAYEIANECDMAASQTFESARSHPFGGGFTGNMLANGGRHAALLIESRIRALTIPSTPAPVASEEEIKEEMARAMCKVSFPKRNPNEIIAAYLEDPEHPLWTAFADEADAAFAVAKRYWGK